MVKLWLLGSISKNLVTPHSTNTNARKFWLNLDAIFYQDQESIATQLEKELKNI